MDVKKASFGVATVFTVVAALDIAFGKGGWPTSLFYALLAMAIATIANKLP